MGHVRTYTLQQRRTTWCARCAEHRGSLFLPPRRPLTRRRPSRTRSQPAHLPRRSRPLALTLTLILTLALALTLALTLTLTQVEAAALKAQALAEAAAEAEAMRAEAASMF